MDDSPYTTASLFPSWGGAQNWIFCVKFESYFWQICHDMDHKVLLFDVWISFNHAYMSKQGYETIKQQWLSLLATQHPISRTEGVPKSWYFWWNLRVNFGRNDNVWTIWGLYILAKAVLIILIHLRRVMGYLSSNGCLSLQHSIPSPVRRGCHKVDILPKIGESFSAEMPPCGPYGGCIFCQKLFQLLLYI